MHLANNLLTKEIAFRDFILQCFYSDIFYYLARELFMTKYSQILISFRSDIQVKYSNIFFTIFSSKGITYLCSRFPANQKFYNFVLILFTFSISCRMTNMRVFGILSQCLDSTIFSFAVIADFEVIQIEQGNCEK